MPNKIKLGSLNRLLFYQINFLPDLHSAAEHEHIFIHVTDGERCRTLILSHKITIHGFKRCDDSASLSTE